MADKIFKDLFIYVNYNKIIHTNLTTKDVKNFSHNNV